MSAINEQVLDLLTKIRHKVSARMEAAWGPEAVGQPSGTSATLAEPGELEADNPTDANDAWNMYMINIVERLVAEFDMDQDDAVDFVFDCADELAEEGDLPVVPEDDASDQDVSLWLGTAQSIGFGGYVLAAARYDFEEE